MASGDVAAERLLDRGRRLVHEAALAVDRVQRRRGARVLVGVVARGQQLRAARFIVSVDERVQVVALSREVGERRLEEGTCRRSCDLPRRSFRLVLRPGIPQPTQRDTQLGRERRGAALRCHIVLFPIRDGMHESAAPRSRERGVDSVPGDS